MSKAERLGWLGWCALFALACGVIQAGASPYATNLLVGALFVTAPPLILLALRRHWRGWTSGRRPGS